MLSQETSPALDREGVRCKSCGVGLCLETREPVKPMAAV